MKRRVYGAPHQDSRCPYCHRVNDCATAANPFNGRQVVAGDVSLCVGCGRLAVFTGDGLEVRRPTALELHTMLTDPDVIHARAAWARAVDDRA